MKYLLSILLIVLTVGCANSPVRMKSMSDSELASSFSREDASELCRLYLRGLEFALEDPSSGLARSGYRANPLIEKEWERRGLRKDACASPVALAAIRSKIENDRAERRARAAAPRTTISTTVEEKSTNCTSTLVGKSVFTNCY